ncbi:MAG: PH domain-containing protein [Bacillota bacterium]|nr:PH domain-containing protein [Bacillota bacterium]
MQKQNISINSKKLLRLRALGVMSLCAFITGGLYVFSSIIATIFGITSVACCFIYILIYVNFYFRMYSFELSSNSLLIKKGVFLQNRIVINASRIQYIESLQSPVQKKLGMLTLMLHTAGSIVLLSNISNEQAKEVKITLLSKNGSGLS